MRLRIIAASLLLLACGDGSGPPAVPGADAALDMGFADRYVRDAAFDLGAPTPSDARPESDVDLPDLGGPDAAARDLGPPDAAEMDLGLPDLGPPDAGPSDAAPVEPRMFRGAYPLHAEFPEGGIYDDVDHVFYVGSLADGSVHRVDANTGLDEVFFLPEEPGLWWTLGMAIDSEGRFLYVCAMEDRREEDDADPPYDGYVWAFDLVSGERTAVHDLADESDDATCTDVTVGVDGTVYVVDRENPRIYAIDDQGDISTLVDDEYPRGEPHRRGRAGT